MRQYGDRKTRAPSLNTLKSPAAFDELLSSKDLCRKALKQKPKTSLGKLRKLHLQFVHNPEVALCTIEAELAEIDDIPTYGLASLIKIERRLFEELAQQESPEPANTTPLELENSCIAHAAMGNAMLETGHPEQALRHFSVATTLASALGMERRLSIIKIDFLRARSQCGDPAPREFLPILTSTLSKVSRQWAQRQYAHSLMAVGAYMDALRALGVPQDDDEKDAALREYLHALLKMPPVRARNSHMFATKDGEYARLAYALRDIQKGRRIESISDIRSDAAGYDARILEGLAMRGTPALLEAHLCAAPVKIPPYPNQRAHWALLRLYAALETEQTTGICEHYELLEQSLPLLRTPSDLAGLLQRYFPELLGLLSVSSVGEHFACLKDLTLLVGQTVIRGELSIRLPGRTGCELVLMGAGHPNAKDLNRAEKKRFAEAMAVFKEHPVVNVGTCLRYAALMYKSAHLKGAKEKDDWETAYERLFSMLTPNVQVAFADGAEDYLH